MRDRWYAHIRIPPGAQENLGGAAPSERELQANESSIDRWLPGALRYEVTEAPQLVYTCHCTECQRLTGSAFSHGISANTPFAVQSGASSSNKRAPL